MTVSKFEKNYLSSTCNLVYLMHVSLSLLEILSFTTSDYATGMQLVVVCNYFDHVCNYKFDIV